MPTKPPRNQPLAHATRKDDRGTACNRGYDRRHRRMREQELSDTPLCVYCLARGNVVAAEVIDHITALARGGDALDSDNRQPLCKRCNGVKAATVDKGLANTSSEWGPLPKP